MQIALASSPRSPSILSMPGTSSPVQLRESLAAADLSLPQDMVSRIGEAIQREVG